MDGNSGHIIDGWAIQKGSEPQLVAWRNAGCQPFWSDNQQLVEDTLKSLDGCCDWAQDITYSVIPIKVIFHDQKAIFFDVKSNTVLATIVPNPNYVQD